MRNIQKAAVGALVGLASVAFAGIAFAQEAAPVQLERVEITGSSIKRVDAETALPVQVITRKDIEATGAQTVEQLLQTISAAASSQNLTAASASGATTGGVSGVSIRGLATSRTLVLLNGRRISPYGMGFTNDSSTVDVNSIPLAAVERVEVLLDGASAIYGSDAIAGVVNFVLRKDVQGAELEAYYGTASSNPYIEHLTGTYGYGDLARDKFNVMAVVNYQKENSLFGRSRDFAKSGINVPNLNDSTSGNTFPGNFVMFDPTTGAGLSGVGGSTNPYNPTTYNPANPGCAPSVKDPLGLSSHGCRFDPSPYVTLVPKTERLSVFASAKFQINSSTEAFVEASLTRNKMRSVIQPVPLSDQFPINSTNVLAGLEPYNGVTNGAAFYDNGPAFYNPASTIVVTPQSTYYPTSYVTGLLGPGYVGALPDLLVRYRCWECGPRDLTDTSTAPRIAAGLKGIAAGWDYDAAFLFSSSSVTEHVNGGYPALSKILPILNNSVPGTLGCPTGPCNVNNVNFWGPNDPTVSAMLQGAGFVGDAFTNSTSLSSIQAKASRDIMQLPAGPLAVAVGVEERHETYKTDNNATIQTGDISGYGGNFLNLTKGRNVSGLYAEADIPIVKGLEADIAVRHDSYQGSGGATVPKFSLRWQATKEVLLRGSLGKGFRAPSLGDLYAPTTSGVTNVVSDPARCPVTGSPSDCSTQFPNVNGGTATLKNETSQNRSWGIVLEPMKDASVSIDFFHVTLTNQIGAFDAWTILNNPTRYASLITRAPPTAGDIAAGIPGAVILIDSHNTNAGLTKLSGIDFDGSMAWNLGDAGRLKFHMSGTYFSHWDSQGADGSWGSSIDQVNTSTGGVISRWRHFASLNWVTGPWSTIVTQMHQNSYGDTSGTLGTATREVGQYTIYGLNETYSGYKNLDATVGVSNLFNTAPPYSNIGGQAYFQAGYDPSYVDPRGRFVYLNLKWKLK